VFQLGHFRQEVEDRHSHKYQNAWYVECTTYLTALLYNFIWYKCVFGINVILTFAARFDHRALKKTMATYTTNFNDHTYNV